MTPSTDRSDYVADLLREVREGLVDYVQRHPATMPRSRQTVNSHSSNSTDRREP